MNSLRFSQGNIEHHLINGRDGDPAIYSFFQKTGDAILFDLGSLDNMSHKELLKVRHVCVSHTHIDHFIGFDRLLRINIPHFRELTLCGPSGLCANVVGKLRGYTWNLLSKDQLVFYVHEVSRDGQVASFQISNSTEFHPQAINNPQPLASHAERPLPEAPGCFVANLADRSRVEAVALDHRTSSIAYLVQAPMRFKVVDTALERLGLSAGPWIRELQTLVAKADTKTPISIGEQTWNCAELAAEVLVTTTPRSIGYLSDLLFSQDNLRRIRNLMLDVEVLFCEASFAQEDHEKAFEKAHLTTRQAALIAAFVRAGRLEPFHHSRIYRESDRDLGEEAQREFEQLRRLKDAELASLIDKEIAQGPDKTSS